MTATTHTGGRRLIGAAAGLAAAGILLLCAGMNSGSPDQQPSAPRAATAPSWSAHPPPASASPSVPERRRSSPPAPASSVPQQAPGASLAPSATGPVPAELPPPGSGPAADPLIQQALDRSSTPDLPADEERLLLSLARTAWLAETAGYTRVRIQAAIARRDTAQSPAETGGDSREGAVVRLVWAGADRAGTFLDGRTAALHYTQNGQGSWNRM